MKNKIVIFLIILFSNSACFSAKLETVDLSYYHNTKNEINYPLDINHSKSKLLIVMNDDSCGNIFIPNCFTPNGDGINDEFEVIIDNNCFIDYRIIIFDRWGQKIFESNNLNEPWDGTYFGKPFGVSVLVYILKITLVDSEVPIIKKGIITIIK